MAVKKETIVELASNKKARHLYEVVDSFEAGIVLSGTEVKSSRMHNISFNDSYADISRGEMFIKNLHIGPYKNGTIYNHEPIHPRKLLIHKKEIIRIEGKMSQKGLTLIPLRMYAKDSWIKVEMGLCRGKKEYEKRDDIKKKEAKAEIAREIGKSLKKGSLFRD